MKKRYELVAHVFDKKGKLLSVATNNYKKTHPLQSYFAKKVGHPERIFLHAELAALLKCKDKEPYEIRVFRYGVDGATRCARPCEICMESIKAFGVQVIWYSDIGNTMVQLKAGDF